ncbi:MAG: RNA polymerase sigma factor [Planctomycetota bacterium]
MSEGAADLPASSLAVDSKALARAARAGDRSAFAELVRAHSARLHRFFCGMGLGVHDADDLVQETFLRAFRHLDRYDARYAFTTWLFTIGRRRALNHLRDRRRRAAVIECELEDRRGFDDLRETAAALWHRARELLPAAQYQALWLRYGEECDLAGIAVVLGVSHGNAKVLLHRARRKLAQEIPPEQIGWQ